MQLTADSPLNAHGTTVGATRAHRANCSMPTVSELKKSLKAVGLAQTGEKPDLERRLRQHGEGESLKLDGVNPAPRTRRQEGVQVRAVARTSISVRATTSSTG